MLRNPLFHRLLKPPKARKKVQVQGGARIPHSAIRPSTGFVVSSAERLSRLLKKVQVQGGARCAD